MCVKTKTFKSVLNTENRQSDAEHFVVKYEKQNFDVKK